MNEPIPCPECSRVTEVGLLCWCRHPICWSCHDDGRHHWRNIEKKEAVA